MLLISQSKDARRKRHRRPCLVTSGAACALFRDLGVLRSHFLQLVSHSKHGKPRFKSMKTRHAKLGKQVRELRGNCPTASIPKELLRKRYRPNHVRILFVGEAPPASGRFFYQADSGLYRAVRDTFIAVFPNLRQRHFLDSFRTMGCYLVDLCRRPVDRMERKTRQRVCSAGEAGLNRTLRQLRPEIVVTVVRSINRNVRRAEQKAKWSGLHVGLPYPGRWVKHRAEFRRKLMPLLHKSLPSPPEG